MEPGIVSPAGTDSFLTISPHGGIRPRMEQAAIQKSNDVTTLVETLARAGRKAQRLLAGMPTADKARALRSAAAALRAAAPQVLAANAIDLATGEANGLSGAMLDRLKLDEKRLEGIAAAIENVALLPDPVGQEIDRSTALAGMTLVRRRIPIGLIGIIYESRPNVTADAAALCLMSGNAALLRGGSEAVHSNRAIAKAMGEGLAAAGVPAEAIQLIPTQDRAAVGAMLKAAGLIDMIVPRGGKSLVERVQNDARVPVLAHLDGICHTYVHSAADPAMAKAIAVNAKLRRTGICGSMETLLLDAAFPGSVEVVQALLDAGCEVRGDARAQALDPRVKPASANDWDTEYLDAILSVAVVDGVDAAMDHIARHSSHHTDAIITSDQAVADRFLAQVDSAIVMHNASTQFADGGEFGLGAEIGIATGRLHARGPVALEGLTTYKWQVLGTGQSRA
jgi:glutamate-5-semialdehyde dehydrogenase